MRTLAAPLPRIYPTNTYFQVADAALGERLSTLAVAFRRVDGLGAPLFGTHICGVSYHLIP